MTFIRIFPVLAALFLFSTELRAEAPRELTELQEKFSGQMDLLEAPLRDLEEKYKKALTGVMDTFQAKGDLDGLVAAKKILDGFSASAGEPGELSQVSEVADLQKIYKTNRERVLEEIAPRREAFQEVYRKKLSELVKTLTSEGRVEDALAARDILQSLETEMAAPPEVTLETGLVLHYQFDLDSGETVEDRSANENQARFLGDARIRSSTSRRQKHLALDGDGDFIEAPNHESLQLADPLTISIWVRPDKLENLRGLVSTYTPHHSWTLRTWRDAERGRISFGDFEEGHRSTGELNEGKWTHLVVTLGEGILKMYFDGELDSEAKRERALQNSKDPLRLGSDYDGRYFQGELDDVRIYRRALSGEEVRELFEKES